MNQHRILVVEDEEAFVDALTVNLTREGFLVDVARDGVEALERFELNDPDLILLDLMLPRISGADVCRAIRAQSQVPIIMVTAKSTELDTVVGLELGADDYVPKPYSINELLARIRAVLRRSSPEASWSASGARSGPSPGRSPAARQPLTVADVSIDDQSHEVVVRGRQVSLPLKEFELLSHLMNNVGIVLSRDTLIEEIWGPDYVGDTKTLDVHIKRLRDKIETEPSNPTRIVTIRGLGYKYQRPVDE